MWELDCEESWVPKNWCFWTVVLEKTLEIPMDSSEIQPVHPEGNQSWIFIGRTDAEAETPILWPPNAKNWLIWNDPDTGKVWRWEEKGTTEDEMPSPTQWTWVWVNSGSWLWTGRLGVLQSMGSQRVRNVWATKLNWMLQDHIFFSELSLLCFWREFQAQLKYKNAYLKSHFEWKFYMVTLWLTFLCNQKCNSTTLSQ